ncbi:MAG TPA: flagellar type III secretion system pore protein FliP [Bacillota bacterium]|nr:flagellar type III secretion system pore protein FliP [Bacillota bacterium]HOK68672.1 flagellar type III secretion system pore protein FliP [Bacillota bacterium]HPP84784.1 flagellar type III secretion system pore protein FliP [Bacillota bacterium]
MKKHKKLIFSLALIVVLACVMSISASAEDVSDITDTSSVGSGDLGLLGANTLDIIISLTLIALIPSILIMTTCFTRIVIVLSCLRNAVGLQQTPPNQVLIGIALFLSLFIMQPVVGEINETAYQPYRNGEITQMEALEKAVVPLRNFMLRNTKEKDLNFFLSISNSERPESLDDIPTLVVIPAFITSELKRAFLIGFLLYLPFLIIDMVVSSTLMSMGMVMLPPTMISLPFKLMLFVLVDGWQLVFESLVTGFN